MHLTPIVTNKANSSAMLIPGEGRVDLSNPQCHTLELEPGGNLKLVQVVATGVVVNTSLTALAAKVADPNDLMADHEDLKDAAEAVE